MQFVLQIWRQERPGADGSLRRYEVAGITADMSFLEMLDTLNEQLASRVAVSLVSGEAGVTEKHAVGGSACGSACATPGSRAAANRAPARPARLRDGRVADGAIGGPPRLPRPVVSR